MEVNNTPEVSQEVEEAPSATLHVLIDHECREPLICPEEGGWVSRMWQHQYFRPLSLRVWLPLADGQLGVPEKGFAAVAEEFMRQYGVKVGYWLQAVDVVIAAIPLSCLEDYSSFSELKARDLILEFSTDLAGLMDHGDLRILIRDSGNGYSHRDELCVSFDQESEDMVNALWKEMCELVGVTSTDFANRYNLDE